MASSPDFPATRGRTRRRGKCAVIDFDSSLKPRSNRRRRQQSQDDFLGPLELNHRDRLGDQPVEFVAPRVISLNLDPFFVSHRLSLKDRDNGPLVYFLAEIPSPVLTGASQYRVEDAGERLAGEIAGT
jgi:hypothetical protein